VRVLTVMPIAIFIMSIASTRALEPPAAEGGDETAPSPDLAGYRLCPKCNTLNPAVAEYCMRCGTSLDVSAGPPGGRKAAAFRRCVLAPILSGGTPYYLGPRAQARFDWGRLAYEPAYAFYPLDGWEDRYDRDTEPHYLENLFRIYFGDARLRPFAAADGEDILINGEFGPAFAF
jgi:hypothetical protein